MTTDISRWGDEQQYIAEPMEEGGIQVHLLSMNPDPLGSIAAMSGIYEGKVFRSLGDVNDFDRNNYWQNALATHLKAPLESIKMHFLLEGVSRSFTHQLVRQRTAVYAQESLRFAVKEDLTESVQIPPSIEPGTAAESIFAEAIADIAMAYETLVNNGVPAEDARELLPQATPTRIHYITDLRNFADVAGNRLCTQAQFHWRVVFAKMVDAIRRYKFEDIVPEANEWQFAEIADSMLFRPVCFHQNKCPFKADYDRACTIRPRVDAFANAGVPSSEWEQPFVTLVEHPEFAEGDVKSPGIRPEEWLANPDAARERR